jgi:hypothetical protein
MCLARIMATFLSAAILSSSANADERKGECFLQVDDTTYINGACQISFEANGSFSVSALQSGKNVSFAIVRVRTTGIAWGYWNGTDQEADAHESLGRLGRHRDCWANHRAIGCAWRKGSRPRHLPADFLGFWTAGSYCDDERIRIAPSWIEESDNVCEVTTFQNLKAQSGGGTGPSIDVALECAGEGDHWKAKELWRLRENESGPLLLQTQIEEFHQNYPVKLDDKSESQTRKLIACRTSKKFPN